MSRFSSQLLFGALLLFPTALSHAQDAPRAWGDWPRWGDEGDGTYRNPILPGDYSDIDFFRYSYQKTATTKP